VLPVGLIDCSLFYSPIILASTYLMVIPRYNRKGTLLRYPSLLEGTAGVGNITFAFSTSDKKSCKSTHCIINHIKPQPEIKNTFYHKVTDFREENCEIEK
jgi:hypothetical protein